MQLLINDTETIGLHPPAPPASGVVEVAYVVINSDTLEVEEEFCSRVNPGAPIHPKASEVHGIYDEDVVNEPELSAIFHRTEPTISIGHSTSFDIKFLAPHYENLVGSLCTLALSRQYFPDAPNHKLGTMATYLGLPPAKAHSALGDVHTTLHLLRILVDKSGRTLEKLITAARKPKHIHTMPFGKHKGMLIHSLPFKYVSWFLEQEIDQDLRYSLEQYMKAKA